MGGVAGGWYKAVLRKGKWGVRAPDGRIVHEPITSDTEEAKREAEVWARRANQTLRALDQR